MKSRSPRGSSTPTSRLTSRLHGPLLLAVAVVLIPLAGFYVIEAFIAPNPLVRIGLRSLPALPVATLDALVRVIAAIGKTAAADSQRRPYRAPRAGYGLCRRHPRHRS